MHDSEKIPLRNPHLAGVLAFLVPGLGHFYQRRFFKGSLYSICILGTFFAGMCLGDWKVVYYNWGKPDRVLAPFFQVWAGLPALPAFIQGRRMAHVARPDLLNEPASGKFRGELTNSSHGQRLDGTVEGQLDIEPVGDGSHRGFRGRFVGTLAGKYSIAGNVEGYSIDPRVAPFDERDVSFDFVGKVTGTDEMDFNGTISGGLQRPFLDWYNAPLHDNSEISEPTDLERANDELGGYFELGTLYTMVAGLLNVLAIYDALEGPAYGSGEEEDEADDEETKPDENAKQAA